MPNIIEQQDLLKGLPDNRLALLMQQPTGDIPPFLVAAEAQRRQAIRQQFAGSGTEESVVDSLTKQLANVPQNIQGSTQSPPVPQAGIAALQQAPQQGAPQAPQQEAQQMAYGGMVQRYQTGSLVTPTFRGRYGAGGYEEPSSSWGVLGDLYDSASASVGSFAENLRRFGVNPTAEQREQLLAENEAAAPPILDITTPDIRVPPARPEFAFGPGQETAPYIDLTPKKPKPPEDTTTSPTSIENRSKAEAGRLRSELESLFATEEPSNWEEAQKWFAMSAQIMNPDANLMQGLVNAGAVYAEAEADQARERRAGERDLKEALLRFDLDELQNLRASEAAQAEAAAEFLKTRTNVATGQLDDLYRQQREVAEQIRRIDESVMKGEADPAAVEGIKKALQQQFNAIGGKLSTYEGFLGETYGFPTIPTVNLQTGKIE